jgi:TldD protein
MNSVEQELLANSQLDRSLLNATLENIHQREVDLADLYFQASAHESWMLEDGIVKEGSYNIERGVGVRAISGEKNWFCLL